MTGPYDDIIGLPHHISSKRPRMPAADRAAQFSPFAALSGYGAAIRETARLTDRKIELSEDEKCALNARLQALADRAASRPTVSLTYFQPDEKKEGGAYVTVTGAVKRVDALERAVVLTDGTKIPVEELLEVQM